MCQSRRGQTRVWFPRYVPRVKTLQDVSIYYLSEGKLETMFGGKTKNIVVFFKKAYGRKHSGLNLYCIPIAQSHNNVTKPAV